MVVLTLDFWLMHCSWLHWPCTDGLKFIVNYLNNIPPHSAALPIKIQKFCIAIQYLLIMLQNDQILIIILWSEFCYIAILCTAYYIVYDGHFNENATKEQHAVNIFRRHKALPLYNISEVATHLNEEKIISRRKQKTIHDHSFSIDERCLKLKMAVQKAISKNYQVLWTYACICDRTGNQLISRVIMTDFGE